MLGLVVGLNFQHWFAEPSYSRQLHLRCWLGQDLKRTQYWKSTNIRSYHHYAVRAAVKFWISIRLYC